MPSGFQLVHKLAEGFLDVSVRGWMPEVLRAHVESLPPSAQLPEGWRAEALPQAKSPVLRRRSPTAPGNLSVLSPDAATLAGTAAAEGVAGAAMEIARWLQNQGGDHSAGPSMTTLRHNLDSARTIAIGLGRTDVEDGIDRVVAVLDAPLE